MSEDSPIPSPSPDTPPPALSDVGTPVDSSAISPSSPGSPHPVASVGPTEEAEAHNAAHDAKDANAPSLGIGTIVRHPSFGVGRIFSYEGNSYVILFRGEAKKISFDFQGMKVEEPEGDPEMDRVREAVRDVLAEYGWVDIGMEMSSRFQGGAMILEPGKPGTQAKEIPLETFFKKIIGVREKLRVLEQKINNHKSLSEEEKLELEGYITRCYGSLTTFNVLFADKEIYFRGTGKGG